MPTATSWLSDVTVCQIPQAISLLVGHISKKAGAAHTVHWLASICLAIFRCGLWSSKATGLEESFEGKKDDVFPGEDLDMLQDVRLWSHKVWQQQQRSNTAQGWSPAAQEGTAAGDGEKPVQLQRGQKAPGRQKSLGRVWCHLKSDRNQAKKYKLICEGTGCGKAVCRTFAFSFLSYLLSCLLMKKSHSLMSNNICLSMYWFFCFCLLWDLLTTTGAQSSGQLGYPSPSACRIFVSGGNTLMLSHLLVLSPLHHLLVESLELSSIKRITAPCCQLHLGAFYSWALHAWHFDLV